ncbi:hypothetical protein TSUD_274980 [Trifolium subterraneum]|uniref:Reverse transcriptase domain-containing protein n=1 Tax=Trifolium subterraneum TaxID=3900 RepID=A0A2Z6N468_TRISU|nr:hypothetical protein TSUD_274980 [Trifolium subterraneum]
MKGVGKDMTKYLKDFQFGVGISGGAEAILHSVNRVLSERHGDGSLAMLTVDFSNAFNMVDRSALLREVRVRCPSISLWVEFLYGQEARLYIGDEHIMSATGVQQGDPLGPLLFALVLHPLIHMIRDNCKLLLHAWYLDDGIVVGDSREVAKALDIIRETGPGLGLDLNIRKTEIFWPSCDGNKLREGLFPSDIGRPMLGVKLLGGAVSRDKCFIEGVAMKRAVRVIELMHLPPRLRDPQSELLLLRSETGPGLGLDLNIRKTEIFWPSCDGNKLREGLFPSDIGRPMLGVKLLGGAVSRDKCFIEGVAMKRAVRVIELMHLPPRTCQPRYMKDAAILFDKELRGAVEDIVVGGGRFFRDFQWRIASLPIKAGGLGLYSAVEANSYAFVASRAQSWVLQEHILRDSGVCGMDSDFYNALDGLRDMIPTFDFSSFTSKDTVPPKAQHVLASALFSKIVKDMEVNFQLTIRQKTVFGCLQAAYAQDFLLAIPIDGLGQHMSPVEYRTILKYRLMIPLFLADELCPVCRKACLDRFGEHAVHCRELPNFKYRHDFVRDVLFDVFKRAGISVKKEAPVNFLTDPLEGRSTLRPADVLVYRWAALKAASNKVAKHERACSDNQHAFIPFAFDTFGFLAPDAVNILQRIQRVMHNNVVSPSANSIQKAKKLKAEVVKGSQTPLILSMEDNQEIIDEFNGIQVWWSAKRITPNPTNQLVFPGVANSNAERYLTLTFHKRHRDLITTSYIQHVLEQGKAITTKNRRLKLYTNNPSDEWWDAKWSHTTFEHPARFETLAMESEKKEEIIQDLLKFKKGKEYYAKVGKTWKRGYLLFGPPGTGKSTMCLH